MHITQKMSLMPIIWQCKNSWSFMSYEVVNTVVSIWRVNNLYLDFKIIGIIAFKICTGSICYM